MFDNAYIKLMTATLSPAKGFALVRTHLETQIGFEVTKFDIVFDAIKKEIFFIVYDAERFEAGTHKYISNKGKMFINLALDYLEDYMPKGASVDKCIINIYPDKQTAYLFYQKDGEKGTIQKDF